MDDINQYRKLVITVVRHTIFKLDAHPSLGEEDLIQEGLIALLRAKQTFKGDGGAKFETYASTCIRNRLIDILRKESTQIPSKSIGDENNTKYTQSDIDAATRKTEFLEKEEILKTVLNTCTDIERAILNTYLQGYSYTEIAKIFEISNKKIDNTIQKIKQKIKQTIQE
ncbi:MAG: sigma-70 family RNA polymerase sigma factor [Firmicutes bacterium]|nr:sigma-70 family RNA polymerase sigma factor [Bacillota bacterium]